jgi:hypothetical protein
MKGTHQILVFPDDVNIVGETISTMKKNKRKSISQATKEVGLQTNADKTKQMSYLVMRM